MKVKELIEKLKEYDGEMEVVTYAVDTFYKPIACIETLIKTGEIGVNGDYFDCIPYDEECEDYLEENILYVGLS